MNPAKCQPRVLNVCHVIRAYFLDNICPPSLFSATSNKETLGKQPFISPRNMSGSPCVFESRDIIMSNQAFSVFKKTIWRLIHFPTFQKWKVMIAIFCHTSASISNFFFFLVIFYSPFFSRTSRTLLPEPRASKPVKRLAEGLSDSKLLLFLNLHLCPGNHFVF